MTMTVAELIEQLQLCEPEAEVRLAQQPTYPFEYSVGEVHEIDPRDEYDIVYDTFDGAGYFVIDDSESGEPIAGPFYLHEDAKRWVESKLEELDEHAPPVVYVGEGKQLGYLPGVAKRQLGWS